MENLLFRKILSLIKKNLIIMKRNTLSTFLEIFFPILLFIIMVILKKTLNVEYYTFEEHENGTFNYTSNYFISSLTNITNKFEINRVQKTWLDFPLMHPFYICSNRNILNQSRPKIASINIPNEIKQQIIKDSSEFSKYLNFKFNNDSFIEFDSVKDMENHIVKKGYLKDENNSICFGIKFLYDNKTKKYDYSLHFFDYNLIGKNGKEGVKDIPNTRNGMFIKFKSGPDLDNYSRFKYSAYSYVMKIIYQYILRKESENPNAQLNFGTIPMKYIDYKYHGFKNFKHVIIITMHLVYIIPLTLYIYRMVKEKESGIKEVMKIMGLKEGEYFLSYFLQYLIISLIISFINSHLLKMVLNPIPLYILFFLIFLFSLDIFSLIYFFQSFMDKTRTAIICTTFLYLLMYCTFLVCVLEKTSMTLKVILSIIPSVSLSNGILLLSKFEIYFKKFNTKDISINHYNFSIKIMYIMFIIDFFLYLFLGYYFSNVLSHEFGLKKPWNFLFNRNYWFKTKRKNNINNSHNIELQNIDRNSKLLEVENIIDKPLLLDKEIEYKEDLFYKNNQISDTLEIKNLVKIYDNEKKALDGVNLKFYKNEIFALLGHNGAGKTTLISILTGIYEATDGEILYNDINILDSNNMDLFREKIGLCSQYDSLYDDLSIREHLEMFSIFKGIKSEKINLEINKILNDFKFNDENMIVKNLSTGEKRKLSIAISLIGGSEILILDEPSSGMDITSKRNLWEILKHISEGKIIIITSHYMEEASILGNRIGIINLGKIKCIGSPLFLIEKYGKFMNLIITKEKNSDDKQIIDFILKYANNAEYEFSAGKIIFNIPIKEYNDASEIKKFGISNFFKILDDNIKDLKIKSYNVSMPTLEDVFLNLSSNHDIKKYRKEIENENDKILFDKNMKENYTKNSKFINDFLINIKRKYLIMKRDKKGIILEIIGPILLVLAGLILSLVEMTLKSESYEIKFNLTGKQKIIFSSIVPYSNISSYFINDSELVTSEKLENFGPYENYEKKQAILDFSDRIFEIMKDTEDSSFKEVDMTSDSYIGYYSSLLILEENRRKQKYQFIIALNARVIQSVPIYTHFLLKSIVEKAINRKLNIKFTHQPFPFIYDLKDIKLVGKKYSVIFFLSAALSLMPVNYIFHLVKERVNGSKHLMRISGLNIASYWMVNYLFEIIKYYFTGGICFLLLYMFNYYKDYFYIFFITLGPGMISLTYIMSFFLDESSAQNMVLLINFVIGNIGAIIVVVLRMSTDSVKIFGKIIEYILAFIPSFCFDFSLNILLNLNEVLWIEYPTEYFTIETNQVIKRFNLLLSMIIYSSIECFLYFFLLIIIQKKANIIKKPFNKQLITDIKDNDDNGEIKQYNSNYYKNINHIKEKYLLKINDLRKIYNNNKFYSKSKNSVVVLKNISFFIKKGECFGLLGLNGAGKTTTFKCITQEFSYDNGNIFINGENIYNVFNKANELFGYCPQTCPIFEYLTVYENLEFYARIKGIKKSKVDSLVNAMIKEMNLEEFKDKLSGKLSGGNKRKLTVAIAMIGAPPILLLDEPSTGIDPEVRRLMCNIIHKMSSKNQSGVIISTHSMDEVENLCNKIGIIDNGELIFCGPLNEIKEKYGYGYEINLRIKPIDESTEKQLLEQINYSKDSFLIKSEVEKILNNLGKKYYFEEIKEGRLGKKIKNIIDLKGTINIRILINWIYLIENAFKFISKGKNYFEKIILVEQFENNFLFKLNKEIEKKSIGFFYGLFENSRDECHISEYSIQMTSIEQIFNELISNHNKNKNTEGFFSDEKKIIIDDGLFKKLDTF